MAQVVVNNKISRKFELSRGTRQGCLLSPLLFALALEPLAAWIRWTPVMRELRWSPDWEDRISLYADDILLYLEKPKQSLSVALDIFVVFGRYSGFSINWSKSLLYTLQGDPPCPPKGCPIQIATTGFKYLGIFITMDRTLCYTNNLLPPLQRLKRDIANWKTLPLSLLGKAALFKMMSLPRFLYVLQNALDPVPMSYFREIEHLQRDLL